MQHILLLEVLTSLHLQIDVNEVYLLIVNQLLIEEDQDLDLDQEHRLDIDIVHVHALVHLPDTI